MARRGQAVALAGVVPAVLHLALTLGYDSSYSHQLYARDAFIGQYEHGIYRFRVIGREVVVAVADLLDHLGVVLHTTATDIGHGRPPDDLFTAFVVVNGVAFVALAMVLYFTSVVDDRSRIAYLTMVVVVAISGYVVTPYDHLSYVFTVAAVLAALAGRPWSWPACLVLAVVGTATRESFLVAAAAVVAALLARPRRGGAAVGWATDRAWHAAAALAVGGVGTYVGLRLALGGGDSFFTRMPRELNWQMSTPVALVIAAAGAWALGTLGPPMPPGRRTQWRRTQVLLWILSGPYLAGCVIGGIWFEAPRLLMPVLLCQFVLRAAVAQGRVGAEPPGSQESAGDLPVRRHEPVEDGHSRR